MGTRYNSSAATQVSERELGKGIGFQRVRRITGYLSEVESFNNGKRAELADRVKHDSKIA